jgi:hypothetical protein
VEDPACDKCGAYVVPQASANLGHHRTHFRGVGAVPEDGFIRVPGNDVIVQAACALASRARSLADTQVEEVLSPELLLYATGLAP